MCFLHCNGPHSLGIMACTASLYPCPISRQGNFVLVKPHLLNQALKACLVLVEKRETRYRVQWYYKLFEQTMRGGLSRDHKSGAMPNAGGGEGMD